MTDIFIMLLGYVVLMFRAFTLGKVWAWFIVPMGVMSISCTIFFFILLGYSVFRGISIKDLPVDDKETRTKQVAACLANVLFCLFVLAFGLILR